MIIICLLILYMTYRYAFGADANRLAADDEVPEAEKYEEYAKYVEKFKGFLQTRLES